MSTLWIKCAPLKVRLFSGPILLNGNEFVLAPFTNSFNCKRLQKYNITENKWTDYLEYKAKSSTDFDMAINNKDKTLIIYDFKGQLTTFNTKTDQTNMMIPDVPQKIGSDPRCVIIDNQLHIVHGYKNNKHYVLDIKSKQLQTTYEFTDFENGHGLYEHSLIHLKRKQKLLLLGGVPSNSTEYNKTIWEYSIVDKIWKKLAIKVCEPARYFGCVVTDDERYMIILGGRVQGYMTSDRIYILDLNLMVFRKCHVELPVTTICGAVVVADDKYKNECVVCGFLRNIIGVDDDSYFPSDDIVGLIMKWCLNEWIHVIGPSSRFEECESNHWKIKVSDILSGNKVNHV